MDAPFPEGMIKETEQFLREYSGLPNGKDIYEEVFTTQHQWPLQRKAELKYVIQTARSISPTTIFEIGSDKPGCLFHWCKSIPSVERIIACEIRGTPYSHLFEKYFPHIEFLWLPCSSYHPDTVKKITNWLGDKPIDVMFLDGDKSNFITDWKLYNNKIKSGGIVFVHDINDRLPTMQYHQMYGHRKHIEYINIDESKLAVDRESQGLPSANSHEGWLRHWRGRSCGVGTIFM